jgi:hypothetical protein
MRSGRVNLYALVLAALLIRSAPAAAQWAGRDGWVEEPDSKSLNLAGDPGHAYLDSTSVHRTDDGLIHFNESSNVTRAEDIGKVGLMEDAYDCSSNVKYMCVDHGDWRNDPKSKVNLTRDPALPIYRKYLCGDDTSAAAASTSAAQH